MREQCEISSREKKSRRDVTEENDDHKQSNLAASDSAVMARGKREKIQASGALL